MCLKTIVNFVARTARQLVRVPTFAFDPRPPFREIRNLVALVQRERLVRWVTTSCNRLPIRVVRFRCSDRLRVGFRFEEPSL